MKIIFVAIILLLLALFLLKRYLVRFISSLVTIGFTVGILILSTAFFTPFIYKSLAVSTLKDSQIIRTLESVDRVNNIRDKSISSVLDIFKKDSNKIDIKEDHNKDKNALSENFTNTLAIVYRALAGILGTILSVVSLYFSYATYIINEVERLKKYRDS